MRNLVALSVLLFSGAAFAATGSFGGSFVGSYGGGSFGGSYGTTNPTGDDDDDDNTNPGDDDDDNTNPGDDDDDVSPSTGDTGKGGGDLLACAGCQSNGAAGVSTIGVLALVALARRKR